MAKNLMIKYGRATKINPLTATNLIKPAKVDNSGLIILNLKISRDLILEGVLGACNSTSNKAFLI